MATAIEDPPATGEGQKATRAPRPRGEKKLPPRDRLVVITMVTIPLLLVLGLVWLPALGSVVLSFGKWNGFGGIETIEWVGTQNYEDVTTIYPPFWPAVRHNLIWLGFLFVFPTILGILLAVLLDREMRGSRFYQTAFYMPVVLSLALIGFIWQLFYSRDQGLINDVSAGLAARGLPAWPTEVDWYGDPDINLWAVLVATSWRHAGYVMLLYLAGLKGVDATLREAAAVDGASEVKTFFHVIFPVMRPINMIVLVIVVIESLRAFDLVWVINKGRNGLELIAALVSQNVIGEATRYGFGSALAVIMMLISSVFIVIYLRIVFREERQR
ncbi:MAG: N-acetyl-D-glucosamine ABC transporter, permease protein 1 [uncultured Nocardioides sp.]|uniref:N-acetyl-D-glucosamine ABC transporter, permease protein 1 n=1 Tax=uncultured Nocardioides sp. TaxID=198441 RepID=A0A6J4N336_9ACTN|nr:MAG: N-acetyl-D-glucosamine ABC transporter, permease protein 1 [uncultured Nocardioides sp.]